MNGPFRSGTGTPIGPMAVAMALLRVTEGFFFCPTGWAGITVGSGRAALAQEPTVEDVQVKPRQQTTAVPVAKPIRMDSHVFRYWILLSRSPHPIALSPPRRLLSAARPQSTRRQSRS